MKGELHFIEPWIIKIWDELDVPENVRSHMVKVAGVCSFLCGKIRSGGCENLRIAALLHDIFKVAAVKDHEKRASEYIKKIPGIDGSVAEIVRKHGFKSISASSDDALFSIEEKILYYADKRVLHSRIVNLGERLEDGKKRYPVKHDHVDEYEKNVRKLFELEKEICGLAHIKPDQITHALP